MDIIPGLQELQWRRTLGEKRPEDVFQVRAHGVEVFQGRPDVVLEEVREDGTVMTLAEGLPEAVPRKPSQVLFGLEGEALQGGRG